MTKKAFDKIAAGLRDVLAMVPKGKSLTWVPNGREAVNPPDPEYPNGKSIDIAHGRMPACAVELPCPAPACGMWHVLCDVCGLSMVVSAAGRADDPRFVRVACKRKTNGD